jgi:hypothetical protein
MGPQKERQKDRQGTAAPWSSEEGHHLRCAISPRLRSVDCERAEALQALTGRRFVTGGLCS